MSAVNAEPGLRGVLALAARAGKCELRLAGFDPSPAVLFEARLMMLHDDVMLFSGIECAPDGASHEQEWSVRVRLPWRQGELFASDSDADSPWLDE